MPAIFYLLLAIAVALCAIWLRNLKPAQRVRLANNMRRKAAWMRANVQELVGIPVALGIFWLSGIVLRWVEPNSALYDAGVLQGITVITVHLLVANSCAKLGTKLNIEWFHKDQTVTTCDRQFLYVVYLAAYCALAAFL